MAALIEACATGALNAEVKMVVAPSEASPALTRANELGVPTTVAPFNEEQAGKLLEAYAECRVLCLAGYMRLLPTEVLRAFPRRVLNIHPSLLPKFGGKGMYGHHVHEAVLAAGETESGCTVHRVTEIYDEGEIVLQKRCRVEPGDTAETLAARILPLEHQAFAEAVGMVLLER